MAVSVLCTHDFAIDKRFNSQCFIIASDTLSISKHRRHRVNNAKFPGTLQKTRPLFLCFCTALYPHELIIILCRVGRRSPKLRRRFISKAGHENHQNDFGRQHFYFLNCEGRPVGSSINVLGPKVHANQRCVRVRY